MNKFVILAIHLLTKMKNISYFTLTFTLLFGEVNIKSSKYVDNLNTTTKMRIFDRAIHRSFI